MQLSVKKSVGLGVGFGLASLLLLGSGVKANKNLASNKVLSSHVFTNDKFYHYFSLSEFDSPDLIGSGKYMKQSTLTMLYNARVNARVDFIINSGYRTVKHNSSKEVKGVLNSAHLKGYAVDISTPKGKNQRKILRALKNAGFTRFGIYKNFIHVDNDPRKPQNVVWGTVKINPFKL